MATTRIQGNVFVSLLQNGDNLTTTLMATAPMYQTYKKGSDEYNPNWATMPDANRPIVFPRVYSVMLGQVLTPTNISWKYNGVSMTFDGEGVCTAPDIAAGKVKEITYQGVKALKMIGNVASEVNNDSDTISFTGTINTESLQATVSAEITLLIEEASANLYRLFLTMADDVIDGDETSLAMEASLFNSGTKVTSGVQFEFRDLSDNSVLRSKGASGTFNITRAMIDSELMVVCLAYIGDTVVAREQRQVWDSTDPVTIVCDKGDSYKQNPTESIVYSFYALNARNGNTITGTTFTIKVFKSAGADDITSEFTKTSTSITVPGSKVFEHRAFTINAVGEIQL